MSDGIEVRIKMSPLKAGRLYMKSMDQQNEIAELKGLLKEALLNMGWTENDDLWVMPERNGIWSSTSDPLTLSDAMHINNAMVALLLGDSKS